MADEIDNQLNIDEVNETTKKCVCGCFITKEQEINHIAWSETHYNYINRNMYPQNEVNNPDSIILDM